MAGLGGFSLSPSRYAPTSTTGVRATSAGIKAPDPRQASVNAFEEAKRKNTLYREQELAAFNAGHQARMYGTDVTAKGQGVSGPWQVSASAPIDAMGSAQRSGSSTGTRAATTAAPQTRREAEDLTMADYRTALGEQAPLPARVEKMKLSDRSAAENAAYGRARDAAGSEARAAADSLADEMSARGLAGAGLEGALLGNILGKAQGQLGEVNRELTIDRMARSDAIDDQNYRGEIDQRSQDISGTNMRVDNAMRLAELLRRTKMVTY